MLTFPMIWDISFTSFQIFVGVGIIWMLWIEKLFPSQKQSVIVMIIVALLAAAFNWYWSYRKIHNLWVKTQGQIQDSEAAAMQYEGEIT